jgi:hypothetical protein
MNQGRDTEARPPSVIVGCSPGNVIGLRSNTTDRPSAPGTAPEDRPRQRRVRMHPHGRIRRAIQLRHAPKSPSLGSEGEAASTGPTRDRRVRRAGYPVRPSLAVRLADHGTGWRDLRRRSVNHLSLAAMQRSRRAPATRNPVPDAAPSPSPQPRPSRGPRCRISVQSTRPLRPESQAFGRTRLWRDRSGDPKCALSGHSPVHLLARDLQAPPTAKSPIPRKPGRSSAPPRCSSKRESGSAPRLFKRDPASRRPLAPARRLAVGRSLQPICSASSMMMPSGPRT